MIFANKTAAAVWKESNCDRCFQIDQVVQRTSGVGRGCMILNGAMTRDTPPGGIVKGRSGAQMSDAFRCTEFLLQPPVLRRPVADTSDEPSLFGDLFDTSAAVMDPEHA